MKLEGKDKQAFAEFVAERKPALVKRFYDHLEKSKNVEAGIKVAQSEEKKKKERAKAEEKYIKDQSEKAKKALDSKTDE